MKNDFKIATDPVTKIIRIELWGYWDLATARRFHTEFGEISRQAQRSGGAFRTLVDMSNFEVQSAVVAEANGEFLDSAPDSDAGKVAIVSNRALLRIQSARIAPRANRYFTSVDEALAWLQST